MVVFAQSEELAFAQVPLASPLAGSSVALAAPVSGWEKGHRILISGDAGSEAATVEQVSDDGLTIFLQVALENSYDPATVRLYGNVAAATQGETRQEVLGSGDASQANQQFTLKQSPLTYVSSTAPAGADSTLSVRVNGLRWHETPTLYGHGPARTDLRDPHR